MSKKVTFENLISIVKEKAKDKGLFVIALSGFGGAGKSTTANHMANVLDNADIVALDDFIVNRLNERSDNWQGFDWDRLVLQVLKPIKEGKKILQYGQYDWAQNEVAKERNLNLTKYLIIEGVGLIRPELNSYFDISVWINTSLEKAKEQGKNRDREEYKVDHDELWDKLWLPNDQDYYNKYHPEQYADFVLEDS